MNFEFVTSAFAQTAQSGQAPAKGGAPMWPMFLLLFVVFYFFIIRPQRKKQKDTQDMLHNVSKGDKVVTIGGIYGTVVNIKEKKEAKTDEDIIVLKVAETTKLEMVRSSIGRVLPKETDTAKEEK
jgi:preprotein translocase subunit YajC